VCNGLKSEVNRLSMYRLGVTVGI